MTRFFLSFSILLLGTTQVMAEEPLRDLFEHVDSGLADLTEKQSRVLESLESHKWTIEASIVKLDKTIEFGQKLKLNLAEGVNITADRGNAVLSDQQVSWKALQNEDLENVTFVKRGEDVVGTIRVQGKHLSLIHI